MKISSSAKNSGFQLVEVLVVTVVIGILAGIAVPSMLSQKRTFKNSVNSIETLLKTVNLSARSNSGNPYRITVVSQVVSGQTQQTLAVDLSQNGSCDPAGPAQNWQRDVKKEYTLPPEIQVVTTGPNAFPSTSVSNGICFNGRGETFGGSRSLMLIDTQKINPATSAILTVSVVGDVSRQTFDQNNSPIAGGKL
jgi:prepilin-type N-terminal cleavage/methylation domain-containing protein